MRKDDWINPDTRRASCPECQGYGYHEDGTDEGRECETCHGDGIASVTAAEKFIAGLPGPGPAAG